MAYISLGTSFIIFILFMILISGSVTPVSNVSKFSILVIILNFGFFISCGICGLIKDYDASSYIIRNWIYTMILGITIVIINIIGIAKAYNKALPVIILLIGLFVAVAMIIVVTEVVLNQTTFLNKLSNLSKNNRTNIWYQSRRHELYSRIPRTR